MLGHTYGHAAIDRRLRQFLELHQRALNGEHSDQMLAPAGGVDAPIFFPARAGFRRFDDGNVIRADLAFDQHLGRTKGAEGIVADRDGRPFLGGHDAFRDLFGLGLAAPDVVHVRRLSQRKACDATA